MEDQHLLPLTVMGLRQQSERETPQLLLEDDRGRVLQMSIGVCEALAIQRALEGQSSARPLTHDLILSIAERLDCTPARLLIDDYSGSTYYARLILNGSEGLISLDCRPSDGIALALRAKIPIFASNAVMEGGNSDG